MVLAHELRLIAASRMRNAFIAPQIRISNAERDISCKAGVFVPW